MTAIPDFSIRMQVAGMRGLLSEIIAVGALSKHGDTDLMERVREAADTPLPELPTRGCLAQIEEPAQPVCWIRFCSDGSTEGPIMDSRICEVRKTSGAWTPLYAGAAPAAVAGPPLGTKFFSASNEGLDEHDTAEAAQNEAQSIIDMYREEAADGWPEEVDSVCWGVILGKAVERPVKDAPFMAGILGSDMEPVDYVLEPVAAPALEAPAAPSVPVDEFRGDTPSLVRNIVALLELDADGALVPHGVGGHARGLLSAAAARLAAAPALEAPAAPVLHDIDAGVEVMAWLRENRAPHSIYSKMSACLFGDPDKPRAALAAAPQAPAGLDELRKISEIAACWGCDHPDEPGDTEVVRRVKWAARQLRAVAQAPAAPDELSARLRKAAATLAVRHSSYSNISIAWPDEKLLKSAEGRYHQALADLDALISAIPTETKQTADRDQLDSLARKKLGALLNAFGEAQWQAGRGVPCPSIEDAFEAVISAAVGLLAAQPVATDAYLKLADAMGYDSGKDGIEWSPEEWAAHLLAAYRVAPAAPFGYAAYWPNQVEKATLFPPKLGDSTWAAFRNAGQIVTPLYERPAPAAPAVDTELLELAQAIVRFNREHGSILAVHIDNLADLVDERAAQAQQKGPQQ